MIARRTRDCSKEKRDKRSRQGLFRAPIKAMLLWERGEATKRAKACMGSMEGERKGVCFDEGQAKKSTWRMPWHQEPKKDVTSCDKLRIAANKQRPADFRMGKPGRAILCQPVMNK